MIKVVSETIAWDKGPTGTTMYDILINGVKKSSTKTGLRAQFALTDGDIVRVVSQPSGEWQEITFDYSVEVDTPPPSSGKMDKFGTANGWHLNSRSSTDQDFEIATCADLGAKVIRMDGANGSVLQKIANKGMHSHVLLASSAPGGWSITPSQFAISCAATAKSFGGLIKYYEIMNEVDLHGWTAAAYVPYLKAAYDAIKAVDSDCYVFPAGLWKNHKDTTGGSIGFVEGMYAAGVKGHLDAINLHLYDDPAEHGTWQSWDMAFGSNGAGFYDSKNIRSVMNANGDNQVPIICTEMGGPTPKYSESKQAQIVTNALHCVDGIGLGYRKLAMGQVYDVIDDDVVGYGMLRPDRTKRPSYFAYKDTVATIG